MNIIEFFFGIFKECFNVINVDFFGLGFTWLELLLGVTIIFVIMGFLKSIVGVADSVTFDTFMHNYKMTAKMSNRSRENQVVSGYFEEAEPRYMSDKEEKAFRERLKNIR